MRRSARPKQHVKEVAARPYDVLNSAEAKTEASEKSLLHITKPEIDFDPIIDEHSDEAYSKAVENFRKWQDNGWLVQDDNEHYYIYAQTMNGRTQYGIVIAANVADYMEGRIKKHELTRRDKEEDRMKHVRINNANVEPVFFAFPDNTVLQQVIDEVTKNEPEYDFTAPDGFGHHFWVIDTPEMIATVTSEFERIPYLYIADGHHRSAAAALVGHEKAQNNPAHKGDEEYNYFLAVAFPASHLNIIDYNRVVRDLNGLTPDEFLARIAENFTVEDKGTDEYRPEALHNFSLYLGGRWYSLTAKPGTYNDNDPIGILDVTISSDLILRDILGITTCVPTSVSTSLAESAVSANSSTVWIPGEMAMALALYPVSMKQLMDIADSGNIMPPKTTWFEPKLRSGLVIHKLD